MIVKDIRQEMLAFFEGNAQPKKYRTRQLPAVKEVILHCDDIDASVWAIARYDRGPNHISKLGCPNFTYNYFVEKDGTIYYTVDENTCTWHAGEHNSHAVGVCLRYKATDNDTPPPTTQLEAAASLIASMCLRLRLDPDDSPYVGEGGVLGHREIYDPNRNSGGWYWKNGVRTYAKTCPGLKIDLSAFRMLVAKKMQEALSKAGLYTGKIDGLFGPKSNIALRAYTLVPEDSPATY